MAIKSILKRQFLWISLCAAVASLGFWSCVRQELDKTVQKAYELRMNGKADEAFTMLEQVIAEDSTNAAAWYELARTKHHIGLGNLRELLGGLENMQQTIEKAVEYDPDNVIYSFYKGYVCYFRAYASFMREQPDANEKVKEVISAYESVLSLKPDYYEAMLYLVEVLGIPEDMGGDKSKAEQYARQLEGMDSVFGAKARSILLPEEVDRVDYWQKVLKKHEGNADVIEELGKAYLRADKVDRAVSYFEKAIEIDPEKASLFLDLSIYHTFRGMRAGNDKELLQTSITLGDAAVARYIKSEPIQPMLAYALGVRSKYKSFSGDKEQGQALFKQAEALDRYFSKATGAPHPDLFIPPGEVSQNHRYLMRPF